jgi:hypothetical protein
VFERRYFIVAQNYHGTTLLSKLLNDHPEVVSLGDTYPSNRFDQVCGCGAYVSECLFWRQVADQTGAERYRDHPHLLPDSPRIAGGGIDRLLYNGAPLSLLRRLIPRTARETFSRDFEAFETAVHDNAGRPEATVFVDAVKSISRVYSLIAVGVRVDGVIHLYRGPSDYIGSTMKQKGRTWRVFLRRLVTYRLFHRLARRVGRYVLYLGVTYEGLAEDADGTMQELFDFVRVPRMSLQELVSQGTERSWHFMGNAGLFHFDGSIRRSCHELSARERRLVRLLGGDYPVDRLHLRKRP